MLNVNEVVSAMETCDRNLNSHDNRHGLLVDAVHEDVPKAMHQTGIHVVDQAAVIVHAAMQQVHDQIRADES